LLGAEDVEFEAPEEIEPGFILRTLIANTGFEVLDASNGDFFAFKHPLKSETNNQGKGAFPNAFDAHRKDLTHHFTTLDPLRHHWNTFLENCRSCCEH